MTLNNALIKVTEAMFSGIDLDAALGVLDEMGLPLGYSAEAIDKLNAEANKLSDEAAEAKAEGVAKPERKALSQRVDRIVDARTLLYRLRGAQPGDVTVTAGPVGGSN